jgi:phosphoglycerate dehydrogenase-like enzyme
MRHAEQPVLVLSKDARDYISFLRDLSEAGTEITAADTAKAALKVYAGQEIILGQPDLVAEVIGEMPAVRWVQSDWAGVTPLTKADRTDYLLTGVKDCFGAQMAEYVLGYLLAWELKMEQRREHQANRSWWPEGSGSLHGKTIGIMGTGSIGKAVAHSLEPFGVRITGFSRQGRAVAGFDQVYTFDQLAVFLSEPDYLVCVLPDTPETTHMLGAEAFCRMKNHCRLVNVGRGNLVDEQALADALYAGELAGAVLDVFQQEPLPTQSSLWNAPGLIVTGHVAARSLPRFVAGIFRENYQRYREGLDLKFRIDFERGY